MVKCLCIPKVNGDTTESQIRKIFNDLQLGIIGRVEVISKTNERGEKSKRAFIYFNQWFDSENAATARERFALGKDIKVMYNEPWFWKVSTSTTFGKGGVKNQY
jgi:hypothetical protein